MSGGYFDYKQHHINDIAESLEDVINDEEYSEVTLNEFREGLFYLQMAAIYAQRIDWLLSADDGEDTFHMRLNKDLRKKMNKVG